jgi:redox-sensitive bicupin YhaK (pirin superfamily)
MVIQSCWMLTGEPVDEPVVGHWPFVMNSQTEIRQAVDDYNAADWAVAHSNENNTAFML